MPVLLIKNCGHKTMALGGRPKEEGGHKRAKFSLNLETIKAIEEFSRYSKYKSKVVEEAIELMRKERDPKKRLRLLKSYVRKTYQDSDFRRKEQRPFFENFNESSRDEAIALWFFEAIDEFLHCFKIAWNMKEKGKDPAMQEYLEEYLDADLERCVESLRDGFMWMGKHGNKALFRYLKRIYYDTHSLYENLEKISKMSTQIREEKGELYDEYRKLDSEEAKKRGIEIIDFGKDSL